MIYKDESDEIAPPFIESLIFDLDGVITQTRKTHKKAWKEMFDEFFSFRELSQDSMSEFDYQEYIDGKPRYQGVKSFLLSRSIELPFGKISDSPGFDTICALGNKKNLLFNRILETDGVDLYQDAVEKIKLWRKQGIKTAIVSSSKNCKKILEAAGLEDLFDTRVDGLVSEEIGLNGKPDPDIFIEAAKRLDAKVENSVIFEDAISGVMAGQKGYFALVVGVNRFNNKQSLLDAGADITIDNFNQLNFNDPQLVENYFSRQGIPVFPDNRQVIEELKNARTVIFLDYDGTLSPIVPRPEDAVLSEEMKQLLEKLSRKYTSAVITGRDKEDVEQRVGIDQMIYAGSHGYIITGPDGLFMEHPDSKKIIPRLDEIQKEVKEFLDKNTSGTQLDRKKYAIGIHYRNARDEDEQAVNELVDRIIDQYEGFKKGEGKKILEIKPDLEWHKGKALSWILDALGLSSDENVLPVYIGDDITDEDAFAEIKENGIGILVGGHGQETHAKYSLKNVFQVKELFRELVKDPQD